MKTADLLVSHELPEELAGAIVWWRLQGDVDIAALAVQWERRGLDARALPAPPTGPAALRRAVNELREDRRLVRPLRGDANGWAIVRERQCGDDLLHEVELRVTLDAVGRASCSPADHQDARRVHVAYARAMEEVTPADVGPWLCRLLESLDAVPLREHGGVYFVPRPEVPVWRSMCAALAACSQHVISSVPAMRGIDAVEAFIDAAQEEASAEVARLQAELGDTELGARALRTRVARLEKVESKLQRYEMLLGKAVPAVHANIEAVRANAMIALIRAEEGVK